MWIAVIKKDTGEVVSYASDSSQVAPPGLLKAKGYVTVDIPHRSCVACTTPEYAGNHDVDAPREGANDGIRRREWSFPSPN